MFTDAVPIKGCIKLDTYMHETWQTCGTSKNGAKLFLENIDDA